MNRSTEQKSVRPGAIAIAFVAIASLLATVAAAQNVPPGCSPTSDGGYTCPGPGQSGENYDNGNGANSAGAGAEGETDNPNAADNGAAYDNGGAADNGADNGVNAEGEPAAGAGNDGGSGNGQGLNPSGISSNLSGNGEMTPGTSSGLDSAATAGAALGMTTEQLAKLRARLSTGPLSADELQQLCVQLASRHLSASDAEAIARTLDLNLTAEQLTQLESCAQLTGSGAQATTTRRAQTKPGTRPGVKTANQAPLRNLSTIEKSFRALDRNLPPQVPSPDRLTQYGYSLFNLPVSTFAPVNNVPVSGDYLIGAGDELKILMWGRINRTFDLQVGRDGAIALPEIGPLQVAGLTFAQARKLVEERAGQITGVQVDLTMGRLRTIQVFVIGEVNHPGPYTVSSLSRVSNVLVACGGITKIGSLRKVQLRRGNQIVKELDLYDLLMRGDTGADEQVEESDVIFVPVIGPVVAIAGDVKRPAIYEPPAAARQTCRTHSNWRAESAPSVIREGFRSSGSRIMRTGSCWTPT